MGWKYLCWLGQVSAWFIHSISMPLPSSPLRIHHSSVLRLVWFHYSFARSIYFTNSLNEASLFRSRSGGKSKSCQKGFCIHFKPRYLQATEFCRWHTEGENLGRLLAFTNIFPQVGRHKSCAESHFHVLLYTATINKAPGNLPS